MKLANHDGRYLLRNALKSMKAFERDINGTERPLPFTDANVKYVTFFPSLYLPNASPHPPIGNK